MIVYFLCLKIGGDYMIVENQKIYIEITNNNIRNYKRRGYENLRAGDVLHIDVSELPKGSKTKVDVECDYCGKIISVAYRDYVKYRFDKYSCKHCRQRKQVNIIYNSARIICIKER